MGGRVVGNEARRDVAAAFAEGDERAVGEGAVVRIVGRMRTIAPDDIAALEQSVQWDQTLVVH